MPDDDLQIVRSPDAIRFILPPRRLRGQWFRKTFWLLSTTAVLIFVFGVQGPAGTFLLIKITLVALAIFRGLYFLVPSHAEIVLTPESIRQIESGFRLRQDASVNWSKVAQFEIDAPRHLQSRGLLLKAGEAHLVLQVHGGQRAVIVAAYSKRLIESLASAVEAELPGLLPSDTPVIPIADVAAIPPIARDLWQRPVSCAVSILSLDDQITFTFSRYSRFGRTVRAIITIGITVAFTIAAATVLTLFAYMLIVKKPIPPQPIFCCFLPCAMIASGCFVGLRNFWWRVVLVASPTTGLAAAWQGPLGRRERHWPSDRISGIRTANSQSHRTSFTLSSRPDEAWLILLESSGKRHVLARGRVDDWRWVATELRQILQRGTGYSDLDD